MIDPTAKATAVNEFRMRFLRLYHDATDEMSDDSVPAERRGDFRAEVQFNRDYAAQWFERACNRFGATDGTWTTVPEENRAAALRNAGRRIAEHTSRCEFELDLFKIEQAEALDAKLDECLSVTEAE